MKNLLVFITLVSLLFSCNSDDDICGGGEGSPRMKIKFKTLSTGKPKTLDSIFVMVDYGKGATTVIERKQKTDSLLIPLRVEDVPFTDIFVSASKEGPQSKIRIQYTGKTEYVSPACGIRKLYENVHAVLETNNPVLGLENEQSEIINEQKTHLFLLF